MILLLVRGSSFFFTYAAHCPLPSAVELVLQKAHGVERAVHRSLGGVNSEYKAKIRSLFVNLKDKSNPSLRVSIVEGALLPEKFASMTSQVGSFSTEILILPLHIGQEMASEERKAADKKIEEENFFKSLSAAEKQAETDAFQCSRCKQVRIKEI
jgi:transcription elongation factor S-II